MSEEYCYALEYEAPLISTCTNFVSLAKFGYVGAELVDSHNGSRRQYTTHTAGASISLLLKQVGLELIWRLNAGSVRVCTVHGLVLDYRLLHK